jgi:hypothetical protein
LRAQKETEFAGAGKAAQILYLLRNPLLNQRLPEFAGGFFSAGIAVAKRA